MSLIEAILWCLVVAATLVNIIMQSINRRLERENARLRGQFDAHLRIMAALSSDTDDRIESITVNRCDECPHYKGVQS